MRENLLKRKLRDGRRLLGVMINYPSPELVEAAGYLGFDWVFIDAEHSAIDPPVCEQMVRAADAAGITPIVHLPTGEPWIINRYLNTGAQGILVPHVASREVAERVAAAARFAPVGERGSGSITRSAGYGVRGSAAEYVARANEETLVFGLLEDPEAIEHAAEIAGTPGMDGFLVGPGDLSNALGVPGQATHPRVVEAVERISRAVLDSGKPLCRIIRSPETAAEETRRLFDQGVHMVTYPFSVLLRRGCADLLAIR